MEHLPARPPGLLMHPPTKGHLPRHSYVLIHQQFLCMGKAVAVPPKPLNSPDMWKYGRRSLPSWLGTTCMFDLENDCAVGVFFTWFLLTIISFSLITGTNMNTFELHYIVLKRDNVKRFCCALSVFKEVYIRHQLYIKHILFKMELFSFSFFFPPRIILGKYNTCSRWGGTELKNMKGFFLKRKQGINWAMVLNYQFLLNQANASVGAKAAFTASPDCH